MKKFLLFLFFLTYSFNSMAHMAHYNKFNKIEMEILRDDEVIGYNIDIAPSDLFLVDITTDLFAIQHNFDCGNCGWFECGQSGCGYPCTYCGGNQGLPPKN